MQDAGFGAARDLLAAARRDAQAVAGFPESSRPADLQTAWALQAAVLATFGEVSAWKVGGVTPEQRQAMAIDRPVGAAIPRRFVHDVSAASGGTAASLDRSSFIVPLIECEYAFRLGRDLPRRSERDWTRAEVDAATATMHLAIEIVDPRLPRGSGTLAEVADGFNNGALVVGAAIDGWRLLDLTAIEIALHGPGDAPEPLARGTARAVCAGDPFAAVVQLANAQPDSARGLRAGDVITTGSCTGAPRVPGTGRYRASWVGLGEVVFGFR